MIVSFILLLLIVVISVMVYIYVQQYEINDNKTDDNDIVVEETEEILDEIDSNISTPSNTTTNNSSDCVGNWVLESECDKTCGGGVRKWRYNITSPALDGGTPCAFSQDEIKEEDCNQHQCDDCVGNWVLESECDKTCGGGVRTWRYNITSPGSEGGTPCAFAQDETKQEDCNQHQCPPINCIGDWEFTDDECNKTCGGGQRTRVFRVYTSASNNGTPCTHSDGDVDHVPCNTHDCPQPFDCEYEWIDESNCSKPCGTGTKTQKARITKQAVNGGTCPVTENQSRTIDCNTDKCCEWLVQDTSTLCENHCYDSINQSKQYVRSNNGTEVCDTSLLNSYKTEQVTCNSNRCSQSRSNALMKRDDDMNEYNWYSLHAYGNEANTLDDCKRQCVQKQTCRAINFYDTGASLSGFKCRTIHDVHMQNERFVDNNGWLKVGFNDSRTTTDGQPVTRESYVSTKYTPEHTLQSGVRKVRFV